ncbi:hypothetical protein [Xanthobacter sp. YC-JY1]|uniref:hypothetical protein n=1 Tax=Xanthobacter sp. YC-JY1 TaxID=2419844 RepID=UPI001F38D337|nr:hypothetical protein [Xanthobacter sp. YC-JY1]UJX46652.1 hypothetical protein D7006_19385 [Xanthobacter sp. YC-JY1]
MRGEPEAATYEEEGYPRPSWRSRRFWVAGIEIYCAVGIGYLILFGQDTRLHETIATGLLALAGTTIGSFIFGAAWEDRGAYTALGRPSSRRPRPSFDGIDAPQPPKDYGQ